MDNAKAKSLHVHYGLLIPKYTKEIKNIMQNSIYNTSQRLLEMV